MESNTYDIVFIGGELGGGGHGSDVAEWLADNKDNSNYNSTIYTHTWNSIEVELILRTLPQARCVPFDEMIYSTLNI